jgi:hypothetical protein
MVWAANQLAAIALAIDQFQITMPTNIMEGDNLALLIT